MKTWFDLEWSLSDSPVFGDERQTIWLDIETRKVPAPVGWSQKMRWEPFMVAIAGAMDPGIFFATVVSGTEEEMVQWVNEFAGYEIRYLATREFDEMVLRGRFTNARRAHSMSPGSWPNLDSADIRWTNIRKVATEPTWTRAADVRGRDVPMEWAAGARRVVATHCLRDVLENVLRDPDIRLTRTLVNQLVRRIR